MYTRDLPGQLEVSRRLPRILPKTTIRANPSNHHKPSRIIQPQRRLRDKYYGVYSRSFNAINRHGDSGRLNKSPGLARHYLGGLSHSRVPALGSKNAPAAICKVVQYSGLGAKAAIKSEAPGFPAWLLRLFRERDPLRPINYRFYSADRCTIRLRP